MRVRPKPALGFKITQKNIDDRKLNVGHGVDFQLKYAFCKANHCFDNLEKQSQKAISEAIYEAGVKKNHFENILGGNKTQFISYELDYFRKCFEYVYGKDLMDNIKPEQLLKESLKDLISLILDKEKDSAYDVDPVVKLLSLATVRQRLEVSFSEPQTKWSDQGDLPKFEDRHDPMFKNFEYEDAFHVNIKRKGNPFTKNLKTRPVVFEIGYELETKSKDKLPFRAQSIRTVRQFEATDNPEDTPFDINGKLVSYYWRCSKEDVKSSPMTAGPTKGHFFFFVVGNGSPRLRDY